MALSKKIRFEIFKRDNFKCCYCGKCPPEVTLEVDHINPKSKGGNNDLNNLITACFDCNRGKKDIPLDKIPNSMVLNLEIIKEQQSQMDEYNKFLKKIRKKKIKSAMEIAEIFYQNTNRSLTEKFINGTLLKLLESLPKEKIIEAMEKACAKIEYPEDAIKYFCGICWNIIKNRKAPWQY